MHSILRECLPTADILNQKHGSISEHTHTLLQLCGTNSMFITNVPYHFKVNYARHLSFALLLLSPPPILLSPAVVAVIANGFETSASGAQITREKSDIGKIHFLGVGSEWERDPVRNLYTPGYFV